MDHTRSDTIVQKTVRFILNAVAKIVTVDTHRNPHIIQFDTILGIYTFSYDCNATDPFETQYPVDQPPTIPNQRQPSIGDYGEPK